MDWLRCLIAYIRRGGAFEYRPPVPPKTPRLRRGEPKPRTFYVVDAQGHLVRLEDALAELGLVSDGGK